MYLALYVTGPLVLPLEVTLPAVILVGELTRSSSSSGGLLPEAVSEALGISLAEVLDLYFGKLDEVSRDHLVWDAIGRRRMEEQDNEWLE
jgi:hypothetical protein